MTKTPIDLQDLRKRIYIKAKAEPAWRFWGLYVHVCKAETLPPGVRIDVASLWEDVWEDGASPTRGFAPRGLTRRPT